MNDHQNSYTSEDAWTGRLAAMLKKRDDVITGIGDDCAVVRVADCDLVYTTDAVVESVHFYPGTEPERIGHKMVGRLLSDIAAMGAEPDHVLLNFVVPPACPARDMETIYRGAETLAEKFGVSIVGGDTMKGEPLALHGFATGHVPPGKAILRSGARAGDFIYITGKLGGSLAGKHLDFIPRIREGRWLREGGWASAMMDISDGLARDLPRICRQSGVGAELHAANIPVNSDLQHALDDGEDYELLFTIAPEKQGAFEQAWKSFTALECTAIGTITGAQETIEIIDASGARHPLAPGGYDHLGG